MNPLNHNTDLKEWQKSLQTDTREKFRKNFIESLLIINFSTWFMFRKYLDLFDNMENEAFIKSETRAEYYCKIAQETYKIYDLIRENSLIDEMDQLNICDDKDVTSTLEDYIKLSFSINKDCVVVNCGHKTCTTKRNILAHLSTCFTDICNIPFCKASKHLLKYNKNMIL